MHLILSCEHAGNYIPEEYASSFKGAGTTLNTHRGIDFGALELAKYLSAKFRASLHYTMISRLLIEANRSENSDELFSEYSKNLTDVQKKDVKNNYYFPYRNKIENLVQSYTSEGESVFHLSVHSFTPVFKGEIRNVDVGLLFDADRSKENEICEEWQRHLKQDQTLAIKMNEPYKGTDDGLTTYLRSKFPDPIYAGIEIEVNQKYPLGKNKKTWKQLIQIITDSLKETINNMHRLNSVHH
jgi:predicted N-formylglutamate amidohydrolase